MATSEKDRFKIADPLGEIKRRAEEIWREKGCPAGTAPDDFIEEAEASLLGGSSGGAAPSGRHREHAIDVPIASALLELRERERGSLLGAAANSVSKLLDSHESFCLAELLLQNSFSLPGAGEEITPTEEEIARMLAELAAEYPGVTAPEKMSVAERASYWERELGEWNAKDEPLGFSDRNTMQRLRDTLLQGGLVKEIRPRPSVTARKF